MALHSDHPDTAYLDQVLATVRATPGHEVVPIFLAGFSNGAGMAFRYASERGEMLRGVIPVAGHRPTIPESLPKPIATFYIVGAEDPLIPWAGGAVKSPWYRTPLPRPSLEAMLAGWAQDMHCGNPPIRVAESDVSWEVIYPGGTVECRCAVIRNHGHHWPGGKGQLNPRIAGVNASGFSANQRILDWIETQLPPS
jgi:polyhydroxybutyrate depolymerase